jgi:DNA-binding response OmpR family regulator
MTADDVKESKANVLLVDDDKFLLDMYAVKFSQAGYTVHASLTVKNALEALRGGFVPHAVVFDLVMPQEDGFFLLDSLRKEKLADGATLIALSNQSDEAEKKRALELGATRYIVKASMIPSEVVEAIGEELKKIKK